MADDKIVTKKTAAKKAAPKQASTSAKSSKKAGAPAAASDTTTAKAAGKKDVASSAVTPKKTAPATKTAAAVSKNAASKARTHADSPVSLRQLANVSADERLAMIKEAAFYKAEKRNFAPGHEAEDWAAAEGEIDDLLSRARTMTGS